MGLVHWLGAAGDLLLGSSCPGCDVPGWGLCPGCCRAVSGPGYLTAPDPCPAGFPVTVTAGPYQATMRRLISAHKEHSVLTLTPFLGWRLGLAVARLLEERAPGQGTPLVLVPVPSSAAVVRSRGFDATWAMARAAARTRPGGRTVSTRRLLTHSRRVLDQAGLGARDRRENLTGSLRVRGGSPAPVGMVVIVDDLVTTGSSLTEAARALRRAGVPVLGAATVAATVRSGSSGRSEPDQVHRQESRR